MINYRVRPYYYKGKETTVLVSDHGDVIRKHDHFFYKLRPDNHGYIRLTIGLVDGTRKRISVHRMVAETFISPQPSEKHQIDHIDGDKLNNHVSNLEWVTSSENIKRAFRNGLKHPNRGDSHSVAVYKTEQIIKLCDLVKSGMTIKEAAKECNMPAHYSARIIRGYNWAHISNKYNFDHSKIKY